jgi:Tol biopolymer transport system component
MRADGTQLRQLTKLPGNSFNASWSPDGKRIVFARHASQSDTADVWVMSANGQKLRRLTHTPALNAARPDWQRR